MALFDKLFSKNANPDKGINWTAAKNKQQVNKAAATQNNSTFSMGWTSINPGISQAFQWQGKTIRLEGMEKNPVVMACVRAVVDIVSYIPMELYSETDDGEQDVIQKHYILQLLKNPIARMSGQQLMAITAAHVLTYGNAYWYLKRVGGRIAEIVIVYPEKLSIIDCDPLTGEPKRYYWTDRLGRLQEADAEDMVHFRDLPSNDSVVGYPRAAAALAEILTDNKASEFMNQFFTNSGIPGTIVSVKNATRQVLTEAKAAYVDEFIARGGRGGVMFVDGESTTVQSMAFNAQQLEAPAMRKIARESICAVFGVDPRMVGIGSAASDGGLSGAQYEDARKRLIQQTCIPLMNLIASCINDIITPEFGFVYVRFSPSALSDITEDLDATSKRVIPEFEAGVRGLKETRKELKLPEELADDDVLISTPVKPGHPTLPTEPTGDTGLLGGNEPDESNPTAALNGTPKAKALPAPSTEQN